MTAPLHLVAPPADDAVPDDDALTDLYDQAPCGLVSTTATGIIIRINETAARWLGSAKQDLLGRSFDDLLDVGSRLIYRTRCLPSLHLHHEMREVALDMNSPGGRPLSMLVNFAVRPEVDGAVRVIRIAVFDISGRQAYRRDLVTAGRAAERSQRRAAVVRQASTTFGRAGAADQLARMLVEQASSAFDAAASAVLLLSDDGAELRLVAGLRPGIEAAGLCPDAGAVAMSAGGPEATAITCRTAVTIGDLDTAEAVQAGLADLLAESRFAAMSVFPLCNDEAAIGVLVCFFGRIRHFEPDEVQLGCELAQQAAVALAHITIESQLSYRAQHDQLTGLANRELLLRELTGVLQDADRRQRPMALLFLDLDGFKPINDEHGHLAGDLVLRAMAQRLRDAVRHGDLVSRIGGDEFVVVLANVDSDVATVVADRIQLSVARPVRDGNVDYCVTGSLGVAVRRPGHLLPGGAEELIAIADAAMYRSKAAGKDSTTVTICGTG